MPWPAHQLSRHTSLVGSLIRYRAAVSANTTAFAARKRIFSHAAPASGPGRHFRRHSCRPGHPNLAANRAGKCSFPLRDEAMTLEPAVARAPSSPAWPEPPRARRGPNPLEPAADPVPEPTPVDTGSPADPEPLPVGPLTPKFPCVAIYILSIILSMIQIGSGS